MVAKIQTADKKLWGKKKEGKRDILTERVGILTKNGYQKLIEEADERLTQLEKQLEERVDHKRERFALSTINNEIRFLYQNVPKQINISDPQPLRKLWENVEERLKTLAGEFSFRYIAMFGKENVLDIAETTLPMVAYANNPQRPEVYNRPAEPMRFETNVLPHKVKTEVISSDKLLAGLPGNWPWPPGKTSKTITGMACPVPFHWETPLIIVFGHSPGKGPAQFSYLDDALRNFGAVVVSIFSAMLEMLTEQQTIASFRVLGHEINTQTQGLSSFVNTYIGDVGSLRNMDEQKAYYIGCDVDSYLDQIHLLFRNARHLIDETVKLKKDWFYAYGPLVYKWKQFYRHDLKKNGREMPLEEVEPADKSRPKIYGDKSYLEEMLYNLIDNAMKYSHIGTQIYVDCGLCENGRDYFFSVTSYGREMPEGEEGERLYEIFARSPSSEGVEGVGIGLSLARAIARAHGGTLTHKCNPIPISRFNIPLIRPYLKCVDEGQQLDKGGPSLKDLKAEEQALRQNDTYSKVVSSQLRYYRNGSKGYYPFWTECRDSINEPTFEVTFIAIIPQGGEKK